MCALCGGRRGQYCCGNAKHSEMNNFAELTHLTRWTVGHPSAQHARLLHFSGSCFQKGQANSNGGVSSSVLSSSSVFFPSFDNESPPPPSLTPSSQPFRSAMVHKAYFVWYQDTSTEQRKKGGPKGYEKIGKPKEGGSGEEQRFIERFTAGPARLYLGPRVCSAILASQPRPRFCTGICNQTKATR